MLLFELVAIACRCFDFESKVGLGRMAYLSKYTPTSVKPRLSVSSHAIDKVPLLIDKITRVP